MESFTVIEEDFRKDKNGKDFAVVKLADGRYLNFMFDNFDAYKGLGNYSANITKNGKLWNDEGLVKETQVGATKTQETPKSDLQKKASGSYSQAEVNRGILLQVCVKSACEVFQGKGGDTEASNKFVRDQVTALATDLLKWAEKNSQNTIEPLPF
jgi:hypothetical protein